MEVMSSTDNIHKISDLGSCELTQNNVNVDTASDRLVDEPAWLTRSYLQDCLRKYYKDSKLRLTDVHARPALGKGENYGGVLTRVTAEFSRTGDGGPQMGHYIVKTSYEANEFAKKMMEPYDIFNREMEIYETVLPKLKKLLLEINDDEEIFAETFAVDSKRAALIFEDLNERDFIMPNRLDGLDMDLTKMILRKLAKMHATSAVLNERDSNARLEKYDRGMYNRYTDNYAPCFVGLLESCSRMLNQWEDYKKYGKKLYELKPIFMELGKRVFDATPGHLNVLAHGDLWTNNVLVKYDPQSGKPLDAVIIDFQYSAWGSPAIDLFYFLNTSLHEEMHLHQQDELIAHYYYVLADTLHKLCYQTVIPSLHKFHIQLREKSFYAFAATCTVQPIQRNEDNEDADFDALMLSDERGLRFKNNVFKNPYCQRMIKQLIPIYDRLGLIDLDQTND